MRSFALFQQPVVDNATLRWCGSFMFVMCIYIGVTAVVLRWPLEGNVKLSPPMAAMFVELAPVPAAPDIPLNVAALGPAQKDVLPPPEPAFEPEPELLSELPVNDASEVFLPFDQLENSEEDEQELLEERVEQEEMTPPSLDFPLDEVAAAPTEGAASLAPSQATATWQSALLSHLERHKRYPRKARRNKQEAVVYVRITIDRDGSVVDYRLSDPSNYDVLNQEALALVARAQPMPPPPPEVSGDIVEFVVPIEFFLR